MMIPALDTYIGTCILVNVPWFRRREFYLPSLINHQPDGLLNVFNMGYAKDGENRRERERENLGCWHVQYVCM